MLGEQRPGHRVGLVLRPTSFAPRLARGLVRDACTGSALEPSLVDSAAQVVGELVAMSVRETHAPVRVEVTISGHDVTIRVRDNDKVPSAQHPRRQAPAAIERGWAVVCRLGSSWGNERSVDGRETWVSLHRRGARES